MLGVPRDASADALKAAYRHLALRWHPDRCPDDPNAATRFARLAEAYEVLGDDKERARYDASLSSSKAPPPAPNDGAPLSPLNSVIDTVFGASDRRPKKGRDRRYDLEVSFQEMALGATKTLSLPKHLPCSGCRGRGFEAGTWPVVCDDCDGAGAVTRTKLVRTAIESCDRCDGRGYTCPTPCSTCGGGGEVPTSQDVSLEVPAGVKDGKIMVLRGLGETGRHGGAAGDCFVHVRVLDHPHLRRGSGLDVEVTRPVSLLRAFIGGKIRVPTVSGVASVSLPPRAKDGLVLRMRGFGLKAADSNQRGAQRVIIAVEQPPASDKRLDDALNGVLEQADEGVFPRSTAFDRSLNPAEASDDS